MTGPSLTHSPRACRTQRVVLSDGERTWTVLDGDHGVAEPAEEFLEYLRMLGRSPNTVKSYARALALWWEFLSVYELAWDAVVVEDLGRFLGWLHTGDSPALVSIERRRARFSEGSIALRLQAVCSFYRYQHFNGVETASRLYERVFSGRHPYKPMLEHLAHGRGHDRRVVRVTRRRPTPPPTLTPGQVGLILDSCARWDGQKRDWEGSVRDRLLWALLAETGMRLGEALALKHCDWHTGLGDMPFVEVVPRDDHPHGLRVKNGGYRKLFVSDELDRLYGEYLWRLCDAGADEAVGDLDSWWVFVNFAREPRFQPLRAETVAWQVRRLRRRFPGGAAGRLHAALATALRGRLGYVAGCVVSLAAPAVGVSSGHITWACWSAPDWA
jgi:integrase